MADISLILLRASGIGNKDEPSVRIEIDPIISDELPLDTARTLYKEQAKILADALFRSLPGGTLDALLVEMMSRKVSLFTVVHG